MRKPFWAGIAAILLMAACTTVDETDYSPFEGISLRSVLVPPPVSLSPNVEASLGVLSASTQPLAEAGYYVIPVALANETFKQNGFTVADDIHNIPIAKLREIFGADAALYLTVENYGPRYRVIDSVVEVGLTGKLVDLRSGVLLWQGSAFASSAEDKGAAGGDLIVMLVSAVVDQIVSSVGDSGFNIARRATYRLVSPLQHGGLPYGPYSPCYVKGKDC